MKMAKYKLQKNVRGEKIDHLPHSKLWVVVNVDCRASDYSIYDIAC